MRKKYDKVGNKTAYKEKGKEKKSARKNIEMVNHIQLAKNYAYCLVSLFLSTPMLTGWKRPVIRI